LKRTLRFNILHSARKPPSDPGVFPNGVDQTLV